MSWPEHVAKFRPEDLAVKETRHWIVTVRGKQVTLGSCVILLKRNAASISDLEADEAADFVEAVGWFEATLRSLFAPERFNYVAAMMKDPFVHFHAFPRYEASRSWGDREWTDPFWPAVVEFRDAETSDNELSALRAALRA